MSDEFRLRAYSAELALDKAGKRIKELEAVVDASDMEICKLYDENVKLRDTVKTAYFKGHEDTVEGCFAWCDEGSQEVADELIAAALEVK